MEVTAQALQFPWQFPMVHAVTIISQWMADSEGS